MLRIALVNDLALALEALRRVLRNLPDCEIAWEAHDGVEAVAKCAADKPDLVLMDLIMPNMDGVEATRRIMRETPCAILVVTATVSGNAAMVFEAMGYGALDAVATPTLGPGGSLEGSKELLAKVNTMSRLIGKPTRPPRASGPPPSPAHGSLPSLVALGASTGGPKALADVLAGLDAAYAPAVVVIQHVDPHFARGLAEWLDGQAPLRVVLAKNGDAPQAGTVLVADSSEHLTLGADLVLHYTPEPRDCPFRPSVDAFFKSAAAHWPKPAIAALLTGMGRDGAEGLLLLRKAGWRTIAQDEATSVVYGMPKAAAALGAAEEILPLNRIAEGLNQALRRMALRRPVALPRNERTLH